MKKLDYVFIMLLLGAFTMVGCTKQGSISDPVEKTSEIELSISKAVELKSGAFDDQGGDPYCTEPLTSIKGEVQISYSVKVNDGSYKKQDDITWEDYGVNDGIILDRIILDWNALGAKDGDDITVKIDGVRIYESEGNSYPFVAPNSTSLYASYIEDPEERVGAEHTVTLHEKVYIGVKVLCFEKQDIPNFGFNWFDFEIYTGEEICVYFNCLDNEELHRNVNSTLTASFKTVEENVEVWKSYWEFKDEDNLTHNVQCIPLPGNYKTEGVMIEVGGNQIWITPEQIEKFHDVSYVTPFDNKTTLPTEDLALLGYDYETTPEYFPYTLSVDEIGGARFLHFVLEDCVLDNVDWLVFD